MEEATRYGLTLTVSSFHEAELLDNVARTLREPVDVHFKIDTGMGRLGCWHSQAAMNVQRNTFKPMPLLLQLERL